MRQRGFTYLTVLFIVAFMGVGMAMTGEVWRTASMREREAELLFVGNQYRQAIERYYRSGPMQYPRSLDDLLKDNRAARVERYLRKRYPDPVLRSSEWGLVRTPDGDGIMGVYSRSEAVPFRRAGFAAENKDFADAARYSQWRFVYLPPEAQSAPVAPGSNPQAAGAPAAAPAPAGNPT